MEEIEVNSIRKSVSLMVNAIRDGTPVVAAESARTMEGHHDEWRERATTDLSVQSRAVNLPELNIEKPC